MLFALIGAFALVFSASLVFANTGSDNALGNPTITPEQAMSIAVTEFNEEGGNAISVELEEEDGLLVYEVIVEVIKETETLRYEVEVNALDGTVLEVELDDDDEVDDDDIEEENEHEDDDDIEDEEDDGIENEHENEGEEENEHED